MGRLITRTSFVPDTTPTAFTFVDQTDVATDSTITSAAITVNGINTASPISVSGGTYDINSSGSFTSSAGTVTNGQTVRARHTSSASGSSPTDTVINIGGVTDTFRSTTISDTPPGGEDETPTLWVNTTGGDDSRSKATVAGSAGSLPWATLCRAVYGSTNPASPNASEAAGAGDVVQVVGNHSMASLGSDTVTYNPFAGTVGNPTTFQASGTSRLFTTTGGLVAGSDGRANITWRGFTFNDVLDNFFVADGLCMVQGPAANVRFERCTFVGRDDRSEGNNYAGIFVVGTIPGLYVGNCNISGFRGATSDVSHCGIDMYFGVGNYTFEHNDFSDCAACVHVKAVYISDENPTVSGGGIIRLNFMHDSYEGLHFHRSPNTEAFPLLFHNNIVARMDEAGIRIQGFDEGSTDPRWLRNLSNTYIDCYKGMRNLGAPVANANIHTQNCIYVGGSWAQTLGDEGDVTYSSDRISYNRNCYYNQTQAMALYEAGNTSLAAWQAAISQDANSSSAAVTFTNAGADDYTLVSNGQAALNIGRAINGIGGADNTTIQAGAYTTGTEEIGIEA